MTPIAEENIDDVAYIPQFYNSSYAVFRDLPRAINSVTELSFLIKPSADEGLIFYTGHGEQYGGDFLAVRLKDRHVVVWLDLGAGAVKLRYFCHLICSETSMWCPKYIQFTYCNV